MSEPLISIVMPVFNAGPYLCPAVESLLAQTHKNFELLACDDASSDDSFALLEKFTDPRIRRFRNDTQLGPATTRNRCCELARGKYIAFFDADDLNTPERLATQCAHLEANPGILLLGAFMQPIDADGNDLGAASGFRDLGGELAPEMIFENVFGTTTVMLRRTVTEQLQFDPSVPVASDYDYWLRCLAHGRGEVLPVVLAKYRVHSGNLTAREKPKAEEALRQIQKAHLERLGVSVSEEELTIHRCIARGTFESDKGFVEACERWLLKLVESLHRDGEFPLRRLAGEYWRSTCFCCAPVGPWIWRKYRTSPLSRYIPWSLRQKGALFRATLRGTL